MKKIKNKKKKSKQALIGLKMVGKFTVIEFEMLLRCV